MVDQCKSATMAEQASILPHVITLLLRVGGIGKK
jgi:hypothetical protein